MSAGDGLTATYYNNIDFTGTTAHRVDATVNFNWSTKAPVEGFAKSTYSARWTGQIFTPVAGTYTFYTTSNDGVRLWVNGQLLINNWTNHTASEDLGKITLEANRRYDIRMDYYQQDKAATAVLRWSAPNIAKQVIPQANLFTTILRAPTAPTGLGAVVGSDRVVLNWTDAASNETGFRVERREADGTWARLAALPANAISYTDMSIAPATQYSYRIVAGNDAGESAFSNEISVTTMQPVAVNSFTLIDATTDQAIMTLQSGMVLDLAQLGTRMLNIRADVTGSVTNVLFGLNGNASFRNESSAPFALFGDSSSDYNSWSLAAGQYTVTATPSNSTSTGGIATTTFTVVDEPIITVPSAPSGLSSALTVDGNVTVSWGDADNETSYILERKVGAAGEWSQLISLVANTTSFTDVSVTAGTQYSYRVCAANEAGVSAPSLETTLTTAAQDGVVSLTLINASTNAPIQVLRDGDVLDMNVLPTQGLNVRADVAAGVTKVRFGFDGNYNYRTESAAPLALFGDTAGDFNPYVFSAGVHTVTATPIYADGREGQPTTVSFTVVAPATQPIPAAAVGLTAQAASSSQINLSWADMATNETGFQLERKTGASGTWQLVKTLAENATSYSDFGLAASTQYYYRIRAVNGSGASAYSDEVSALTNAAPSTTPAPGEVEQPGPSNTGPTDTSILRKTGSITVTQDNTVLENIDVTGLITIQANNVTIRNFRINGQKTCSYGIKIVSGKNLVFEHGEIYNMASAGILGANFTARWLNIHHGGSDGLKPTGNVTVEYSWIHNLGMNDGAHADGVQIRSGSNYVFRYNYFDMPKGLDGYRSNATFLVQSAEGQISDVVIDHNWLNGGNYTLYLKGGPGSGYLDPINVRVTNNLFGRDYQYGPVVKHDGVYWDNNRYWDTNELIIK